MYDVRRMLDGLDEKPAVFEQEYFPEMALSASDDPYTVTYDELEQEYVVEGSKIEKMLGYTLTPFGSNSAFKRSKPDSSRS